MTRRLEAQGADVTQVGLAIGRAGIAAVARDAMEAGTTIVVPPEVVLNRFSSARQTPALAAALEATEQRGLLLPADVATAVVLMFETFHNPASFWKPFVPPLRRVCLCLCLYLCLCLCVFVFVFVFLCLCVGGACSRGALMVVLLRLQVHVTAAAQGEPPLLLHGV